MIKCIFGCLLLWKNLRACEFVKQKKISEGKNKEPAIVLTFLPFAIDFEFGEQSL